MSNFHKIGELADLWGFGDEETFHDRVISRGKLKAAFYYSGCVRPSDAPKTAEPLFINGPVGIHVRIPDKRFLHFWNITAVAATLDTRSWQKIYPDYDGTSKWLILEEPCLEVSDELLITHEDAVAFAKEHGFSQPELSTERSASFGDDKPLHPKERQGLLRLIGALAEMLLKIEHSDSSPDFESLFWQLEEHSPGNLQADETKAILTTGWEELLGRGQFAEGQGGDRQSLFCITGALATLYMGSKDDKRLWHRSGGPNINQLAEDVLDHFALRELDPKGLRGRSLTGKLKKAFEALSISP